MKTRNNMQDERVISESNRIYKSCFYILCGALFLSVIVQFNLYSFGSLQSEPFPLFVIEGILLIIVFYLNLFLLARKGITVGVNEVTPGKFPKKRYALISGTIALLLSLGLWTLRFCIGHWEYGLLPAILFCSAIYALTFAVAFAVLYGSFYIAYTIAKKHAE